MKIGAGAHPPPHAAGAAAKAARRPHGGAARGFHEILTEGAAPAAGRAPVAPLPLAARPAGGAPPAPPASATPSPLARGLVRALQGVTAGEARVDALLDAAARGKTFSGAELIAMQATVFRYSQTVDVLSRATDRIVGAVKQTLGTQV